MDLKEYAKQLDATPTQKHLIVLYEKLGIAEGPKNELIKLVEEAQHFHKMPNGVMNVLLEYVCLITNKDILKTKSLFNLILDRWSNKRLEGAAAAIDFSKKEHVKFKELNHEQLEKALFEVVYSVHPQETEQVYSPVEKARFKAIETAIQRGMSNEELGKYVRMIFTGRSD